MSDCTTIFETVWKEKTKELEVIINKDVRYWILRHSMVKELIRERIKEEHVINLYDEFKQDKLIFENFIDFQKKWEKKLDTKEYHTYLENLRNEELEKMIGEELDKEF